MVAMIRSTAFVCAIIPSDDDQVPQIVGDQAK